MYFLIYKKNKLINFIAGYQIRPRLTWDETRSKRIIDHHRAPDITDIFPASGGRMTIPYPSLDTGHSGLSMASSYHYPSISQHKAPTSSSLPSSQQPPSLGLYHQVPVPAPTPERLCLPPPSPGLYNSVTHHPAPSTSAPPTPASGSHGGYGGYNHKGEGPRKPGGADLHHLQQHHHHQHQSYQAFNSFPHSTGRVLMLWKHWLYIQLARCTLCFTSQSICKSWKQSIR